MWVVDTSVSLALALPDENSETARRFFLSLSARDSLWVPALWWYEVANAVTAAYQSKRITGADAAQILLGLRDLPLETDSALDPAGAERISALARTYDLSAYDAAYLELAQRRDLGVASLDRRLNEAARVAGLRILPRH